MPLSTLSDMVATLAATAPLRVRLIHTGGQSGLGFAGLFKVLHLAADFLGPPRLMLDIVAWDASGALPAEQTAHMILFVADDPVPALSPAVTKSLIDACHAAEIFGAVGTAVEWFIRSGELKDLRAALPPVLDVRAAEFADLAIVTRHLFELNDKCMTCCGGAASVDFALTLLQLIFGHGLQNEIMHALCISKVREGSEQRGTLADRTAALPPALSEALQLMEANIEEPLTTDDIAGLVALSRRQLERLFKQYLDNMPARYYLGLRLRRARQLLLESHHSIVQVGLMCGFSSGAHFATAYGTLFGLTPREERQRKFSGTP
jgi:transcriptional regulator GlxA family with amidase domain